MVYFDSYHVGENGWSKTAWDHTSGGDVAFFVTYMHNEDLRAVNAKNGNLNNNDNDVSTHTDDN